jgi:hypothetical protein
MSVNTKVILPEGGEAFALEVDDMRNCGSRCVVATIVRTVGRFRNVR